MYDSRPFASGPPMGIPTPGMYPMAGQPPMGYGGPVMMDYWNSFPPGPNQLPSYTAQSRTPGELVEPLRPVPPFPDVMGPFPHRPPFQSHLPPISNQEPHILSPNKRQRIEVEPESVIDPSLFKPYELIDFHNMICPQMKKVKLECNGLLENNSLLKRDKIYSIFYFYLMKLDSIPRAPPSNRFTRLVQNPSYEIERFYREPQSLVEFIKKIEEVLPKNKIVWLLVERFFLDIAQPFCPTLEEKKFTKDLARVIGPPESPEADTKFNISLDNNEDLVICLKLMFVVRIMQICLLTTTRLDKSSDYLLKSCKPSHELELYIDLFFNIITKFNVSDETRLKLTLMKVLLSTISFDGVTPLNLSPSTLMALALQLNLNIDGEIGDEENLKHIWYYIYVYYFSVSIQHGLPIFLTEDFFNVKLSEAGVGIGKIFMKSININYEKQVEVFKSARHLVSSLHKPHHKLSVGTVWKLLKEYDEVFDQQFGSFNENKNEISYNYAEKISRLMNSILHNMTKANVLAVVMLHYENYPDAPKGEVVKFINEYQQVCYNSFQESLDVLKNYNNYFKSGYEFYLFEFIFKLLERLLKHLQSFLLRFEYFKTPYSSLLKFFLSIIEELNKFPVLQQYVQLWRLQNRAKIILHILKRHREGKINAFELKFDYQGEEIDFTGFYSSFLTIGTESWDALDKGFDKLNELCDTKYSNLRSKDDLFNAIDFPEPEFCINYFH